MKQDGDPNEVNILASRQCLVFTTISFRPSTYITGLKQGKKIVRRPLNNNGMVIVEVAHNGVDSSNDPLAQQLDGLAVTKSQHCAVLNDIDKSRVIDSRILTRLLAVCRR